MDDHPGRHLFLFTAVVPLNANATLWASVRYGSQEWDGQMDANGREAGVHAMGNLGRNLSEARG